MTLPWFMSRSGWRALSARALVGAVGLSIALLIGFAGPIAYGAFEYFQLAEDLSFKARLNAGRVAKYVYTYEKLWRYQPVRLAELIELPGTGDAAVHQRILDADGRLVLDDATSISGPVLRRSAPILVKGKPVGNLEAETSLRPFLGNLLSLTMLSFAIGFAAYFGFRALPLRVLERTLNELSTQNMRFDAALNNMTEGLCMFDAQQRVVVCNDQYARMYGLSPEDIRPGTTFREILDKRIANGIHGGEEPEQHVQTLLEFAAAAQPVSRIQELSDGRLISIKRTPLADGGWVATHEDITAERRTQDRLAYLAHHDALTDLANRVLFQERLDRALRNRRKSGALAVLCLDLDRFKEVNDTLGHACGDALLRSVADRLRGCVRDGDTVARLGGDEFAIVQTGDHQPGDASTLAKRLIEAISQPYELNGRQVLVGASVGIALAPSGGADTGELLRNADLALYRAKAEGRGLYRFFEASMDVRMQARRELEQDLRTAVANGELELLYQPIVDLRRNEVSGFEALLRWNHPLRGVIAPAEFIPIAEDTGLIVPIGEWALHSACREARKWPAHMKVAVNLSPVQFKNPSLVAVVLNALSASGLHARRLELEITESALLQDNEVTTAMLHNLRSLGVCISMDDFGTGYSSLSYLRSFPFDKIKIDRSFIADMAGNAHSLAIVQAIARLGASLSTLTLAEGVETAEQVERLREEGCAEAQGYFFSPPRPASDVPQLIAALNRATLAA